MRELACNHPDLAAARAPSRGRARYICSNVESRSTSDPNTASESFRTSIRKVEQSRQNPIYPVAWKPVRSSSVTARAWRATMKCSSLSASLARTIRYGCRKFRCTSIGWQRGNCSTSCLRWSRTAFGVVAIAVFSAEIWPGILNAHDLQLLDLESLERSESQPVPLEWSLVHWTVPRVVMQPCLISRIWYTRYEV